MSSAQVLSAKDQAVFRSIVKFYETKQYKKGIKAADSILKKHPEHGETLCMKGLTLSYLDKKEEAYELVRKGVKFDLKSHVCWHVYGLLYRQDKDYFEAVKCYRQALKIDPENLQILRDLSLLQIHRRDLVGFAETRRKLLQVKPSNRLNWVGYAIAEHLCQNHEFAWTCTENLEKSFKDENLSDYENSELFMYQASIMEDAGRFEDALESLNQHDKDIVDRIAFREMQGRLCMFLKRYDEAKDIYRALIRVNAENHIYILGYMANHKPFHRFWPPLPAPQPVDAETGKASDGSAPPSTISSFPTSVHPQGMPILGWLAPQHAFKPHKRVAIGARQHKRRLETYEPLVPLTAEEEELVISLFDELAADHPKSDSLQQLILYFLSGERFQRRLDSYVRIRLRKGIPSLFRMMRPFYFQSGKPALIEQLLLGYLEHLETDIPWFGPKVGEACEPPATAADEEPPTSLVFALMVAAYHFDFVGDPRRALGYADRALEHTPTLVEVYACKGRIYRHSGNLEESAKCFDEVRQMDLADRFLNSQCVKALLRVDKTQEGMEKALMFSKEPDSIGAANLHDMQCMWYESAVGRSHWRQQNPGKALKQYHETFKHFGDIAEDKFDFHNYCLRKTTLKAYVAMLGMQDRLYSHKHFRRAAKDAITIYLDIYDKQMRGESTSSANKNGDSNEADMSAADKKKLKHAKARAAKKADTEKGTADVVSAGKKPKKVDDDPNGDKLLEKDPMEESTKLVKTLILNCSLDLQTHSLMYEVSSRQGRLLHCAQSLVALWRLAGCDNLHYKVIGPLTHFCFVVKLDSEDTPSAVREVVLSELGPLLGSDGGVPFASVSDLRAAAKKLVDRVEERMTKTPALPVIEVLYSLKCLKHADRDCKVFLEQWAPQCALALKECNKMLGYLSATYGKDTPACERFKTRCLEAFPFMVMN